MAQKKIMNDVYLLDGGTSYFSRGWRENDEIPSPKPSGAFYMAGREEAVRATPRVLK